MWTAPNHTQGHILDAFTEYSQQEPSPTSAYIQTRVCVFVFLGVCTAHKQHTRRTTRTLRKFCHKPAAAFVAHSTTATKDLGSQQREDKFVQYAGYSRVEPDRRPLRELLLDDLEPRPSRSGALHERLGRPGGCVLRTLACKFVIRRVTQVQTISLVYGEHERLS